MNNELNQVAERYEKRKKDPNIHHPATNFIFNHFAVCERELKYKEIIHRHFSDLSKVKVMEIGAGTGGNIFFFRRAGFKWENIYANEFLPDRFEELCNNFPKIHAFPGDAGILDIQVEGGFDIIFMSTVFSSILDEDLRNKIASNLWRHLKPGGIILWYDFIYNNPNSKDVKGISTNEVRKLFPAYKSFNTRKVTLAPPIGKRVKKLYPFFNLFPFLRTHIIAEIVK